MELQKARVIKLNSTIKYSNWLLSSLLAIISVVGQAHDTPNERLASIHQLQTLAFGSCNRIKLAQTHWPKIAGHNPDLYLWTGDAVYARSGTVGELQAKWSKMKSNPYYSDFKAQVPVIGIWDDHDYGKNNARKQNPVKKQAQKMYLDFLQEPADSPRRQQEGIYTSHTVGKGASKVKFILLDTRYHVGHPGRGRSDTLGKAQWAWLEAELRNSDAAVHVIASSYPVLAPMLPIAEEWADHKWAKKRLFNLIKKFDVPGVLFVTGDRHFSSYYKSSVKGVEFFELMSSGLTHYLFRPRISKVFKLVYGEDNSYFGLNYSLLEFDWQAQPVTTRFVVYDLEGEVRLQKTLSLVDGFWTE